MSQRLKSVQEWESLAQNARYRAHELASLCQVSLRTLQRHFRAHYGLTVSKWLRDIRLREAYASMGVGPAAKAAGCGYNTAYDYLKACGLLRGRVEGLRLAFGFDEQAYRRAETHYLAGKPLREAARRAGVCRKTLEKRLREKGLQRTRSESKRLTAARRRQRLVMDVGRRIDDGQMRKDVQAALGLAPRTVRRYCPTICVGRTGVFATALRCTT